jgi:predicted permease
LLSWLARRRSAKLDEQDFADEIRAHLALDTDARISDGADRRSAELASLKEFGNVTLTTEAARHVWTPSWVEVLGDLGGDLRHGWRSLAKTPAFTFTAIAVMTLGIGLNAAVFTMLKSMALTPLAGVDGSAGLHELSGETSAGRAIRLSYSDYRYLRDNDRAFAGVIGSTLVTLGLGGQAGRSARSLSGELVTGNYFQVLGIGAALGRTLLPGDEAAPGSEAVAVLSHGLWQRELGGDPEIVGRTIVINHVPLTVVGVADQGFHGTTVSYDNEVFIPITMAPRLGFAFQGPQTTQGFLRPGISLASAAAQLDALWTVLARDRPADDPTTRLRIATFWRAPGGPQTYALPTLIVLSAMALLVLAIACANIAGLVLVRAVARRGEIAVRLALGAPRLRIVRMLVVENLVLAVPGALLGILLAWRGLPILVGYADALAAPQRLFFNLDVDRLVVGFAVLAACGSALVFGFAPALRSSCVALVTVINEDASPRGAGRGRLRAALVVAQVAVSLLLLIGAGLVTRSFAAARRTNLGFDAAGVTSIRLDVKQNGYDEPRGRRFYRRLLDAARADPAVESATLAAYNPMNLTETATSRIAIDGYAPGRDEDLAFLTNTVGADYFRTLRIALGAGRGFADQDDEHAAPIVIVNTTMAERFWGGAADALGRRIKVGDGDWRTIVGVAADVKYLRVNETPRPYVYLPFLQAYRPGMILHARTLSNAVGSGPSTADTDGMVDRARAHVTALDPDLPVDAKSLNDRIAGSLIFMNLAATMLSIFGVAGVALTAIGTYGLVSYAVTQSRHDIGVRIALGATALAVVRMYVRRGLWLGAVGAALGLATAAAATRLLSGVLYGVGANDVVSFAGGLAVVLGGVAVATIVPAWRAARTDPVSALRHR